MLGDLVEHAVCVGLILLAGIGSYAAGTRRRPARHGSVQIRAKPPPQRRAATVRRVLQLMPVAARARRARAAQPERARFSRN